jgi:hypothetical protein
MKSPHSTHINANFYEIRCAQLTIRIRALEAELAEREAEIQRLLCALSFWHPGVPEIASEAIRDRAADDAMLLVGFHGPHEVDAVGRGWIKLIVAPQSETEPVPGFCPECLMTGGHKLSCSRVETKAQPSTEGHFVPGPWAPQSDCFCEACKQYFGTENRSGR